jgi:secreted Zn-dependent insulinase-like peptidase
MADRRRAGLLAAAGVLLVMSAVGGTWHYARQDLRRCAVTDTLEPTASLLEDDRRIIDAMIRDGMADAEPAILGTYLQRIRRDGVPRQAAMKQRIDTLVNNNTAILALVSKYAPRAQTAAFRGTAEKFRDYAISFRDRWQSVFETFMTGGNLPAAGPSFPADFADAVAVELSAVR